MSYQILIVEDEIITVDYLEAILENAGYGIFGIAMAGEDALSLLSANHLPDLSYRISSVPRRWFMVKCRVQTRYHRLRNPFPSSWKM